jgi:heparinase II/III-like protein/uncharacterized protein DUF4962
MTLLRMAGALLAAALIQHDAPPSFPALAAERVALKPSLVGVHPRVFVTAGELEIYRARARNSTEWREVLRNLPALKGDPPPPPGPQARRSQNDAAFAIAGASLAYAIERKPEYLAAAKKWTLAAIDYEPWGYITNKPNTDLAAGHLLYAIGWAYDLLHADLSDADRARIRGSLERHAALVYEAFAPGPRKRYHFTQNHNFIPTSGLAVTALALMGESKDAAKWAALARAHHVMANRLLSPDGYYYEGMEYWIFSVPWLVHFYDAWEHSTGESLWDMGPASQWKHYLAHALLPDGQQVFDFGDIWEGALTRAKTGDEYSRVYPGGTLQSNFNLMYRVAARLKDPESEAVAERYDAFRHSNLEEYWTLLWRDPAAKAAPFDRFPLSHHFEDMGVVYSRTSWNSDATAFAFKAGPPEGHRVARLFGTIPEWTLDSGHSHPDNGSFIIWAGGRYLTGDTGYAGLPHARHHNTITVGGVGQGVDGDHDVWRRMKPADLDGVRINAVVPTPGGVRIDADVAAAYPATSALTRFRRSFTFAAPASFTIDDDVELREARSVQWFLHSDAAIEREADGFVISGRPPLRIDLDTPVARTAVEPTTLTAPGEPGAITQGREDRRGTHLVLETAPADRAHIKVRLTIPAR